MDPSSSRSAYEIICSRSITCETEVEIEEETRMPRPRQPLRRVRRAAAVHTELPTTRSPIYHPPSPPSPLSSSSSSSSDSTPPPTSRPRLLTHTSSPLPLADESSSMSGISYGFFDGVLVHQSFPPSSSSSFASSPAFFSDDSMKFFI